MNNFLELGPSVGERTDAQLQLPNLVEDLLKDKQPIAKSALTQFAAWDTDSTGDLAELELSNVYQSRTASLTDRATAGILLQNFQEASKLASPDPLGELAERADSLPGFLHLSSVFEDDPKTGITQKDLSTLSLLTSETEHESFLANAENSENQGVALDAVNTAGFGIATVISLARLLMSPKASILSGIGLAVGSLGLGTTVPSLIEKLNGNQIDAAQAEYARRQAMLNTWQSPKQ